ncbi:MAG: hypothetical protein KF795_04265 [Labilithrix sp.]|nr:hypothetical protein [Labilithrix sp.]
MKAAWIASVVVVGALVASINSGCGDDDPTAGVPARLARKGEACQTTNDCAASLACMPSASTNGGVCVVGVFNVTQTGKECAITECQQASDCCDTPPAGCDSLKQSCEDYDAGLGGSPSSCQQYESLCVCDAATRDCENGRCVVKCTSDSSCTSSGSGSKCLGGKCAQCASDDDCGGSSSDLACVNGKCQSPCQGDGDCAGFDRCLQGKCVEGGCQTTRECIAATRNVEATCGTDGKCIVPCQTDLECGNPRGYSFFSCVGGQCLYMGCESDKDCSLLLGSSLGSSGGTSGTSGTSGGSSGGLTSKQHVICRDKQVPNATTRPAQ